MVDVSLRAAVLALPARLARLPNERGPGLLRYHHDLLSARAVTDGLLALNQGRVVEQGPMKDVLQHRTGGIHREAPRRGWSRRVRGLTLRLNSR
jgi:ABC-type microcin C transport system duplicated ATPase subunit YejF